MCYRVWNQEGAQNMSRESRSRLRGVALSWALAMALCIAGVISAAAQIVSREQESAIAKAPPQLKSAALRDVAAHIGAPLGQLEIVSFQPEEFPAQQRDAFLFKVMDRRTHQIHGVLVTADGRELDQRRVETDERSAWFARFGRLDARLAELLANVREDEPVDVVFWLKTPAFEPAVIPAHSVAIDRVRIEAIQKEAFDLRTRFIQAVVTPVRERLESLGFQAKADGLSPAIYAVVPAGSVANISRNLLLWPEVDIIYLASVAEPQLWSARRTIHADVVQSRKTNGHAVNGTGVKAAMIEAGMRLPRGGRTARVAAGYLNPALNNPFLSGVRIDSVNVRGPLPSPHATSVAGIICSQDMSLNGVFGIAPLAALWAGGSAQSSLPEMTASTDGAINWGATTINLSFGVNSGLASLDAWDRLYDDRVFNHQCTVVATAGNEGRSSGNIKHPGLGYNVVTVGAYDDAHTPTNPNDDRMALFSSFRNPAGRRKPEVVAPGVDIKSTSVGFPWISYIDSGTSFAAPMVTGLTALMMQRDPTLEVSPAAVKAILIATSSRSIPPPAGTTRRPGNSIVSDNADDVTRGQNGAWGGGSYTPEVDNTVILTTMGLRRAQRTRVAISWLLDPTREPTYGSSPHVQLELSVLDPDGNVAGTDAVDGDTSRLVEFIPAKDGLYSMQVTKTRCDYRTSVGFAWWQEPSTVLDVPSVAGVPGQVVKLQATLWFTTDHTLLANKTVTFQVQGDSASYSATTDSKGVATISYSVGAGMAAGNHPITVTFAGDREYRAASGTGVLSLPIVLRQATNTQLSSPDGNLPRGGIFTGTANLTSIDAQPWLLAGKTITYSFFGYNGTQPMIYLGSGSALAVTDANGNATVEFTIPADVDPSIAWITVYAQFAGDADYKPSVGDTGFWLH